MHRFFLHSNNLTLRCFGGKRIEAGNLLASNFLSPLLYLLQDFTEGHQNRLLISVANYKDFIHLHSVGRKCNCWILSIVHSSSN